MEMVVPSQRFIMLQAEQQSPLDSVISIGTSWKKKKSEPLLKDVIQNVNKEQHSYTLPFWWAYDSEEKSNLKKKTTKKTDKRTTNGNKFHCFDHSITSSDPGV